MLTETDSSSHWWFVAQFTLDAIFPLFCLSSHFQQGWMSFPVRARGGDVTGFGFIFPFTPETTVRKMPSLLKYQHKWLHSCSVSCFLLWLQQGEGWGTRQENCVCRASLSQQREEQKRCLGSLCSWAQQCVAKTRSNQMSRVPSKQREDAGLWLPTAGNFPLALDSKRAGILKEKGERSVSRSCLLTYHLRCALLHRADFLQIKPKRQTLHLRVGASRGPSLSCLGWKESPAASCLLSKEGRWRGGFFQGGKECFDRGALPSSAGHKGCWLVVLFCSKMPGNCQVP